MTEQAVQGAMVEQGVQEAMVEQGAQGTMAEQPWPSARPLWLRIYPPPPKKINKYK